MFLQEFSHYSVRLHRGCPDRCPLLWLWKWTRRRGNLKYILKTLVMTYYWLTKSYNRPYNCVYRFCWQSTCTLRENFSSILRKSHEWFQPDQGGRPLTNSWLRQCFSRQILICSVNSSNDSFRLWLFAPKVWTIDGMVLSFCLKMPSTSKSSVQQEPTYWRRNSATEYFRSSICQSSPANTTSVFSTRESTS